MSSSKTSPPPPLNIGVARAVSSPVLADSPKSADKVTRSFSEEYMHSRKISASSTTTSSSTSSRKPSSPTVNVYTHCGRHTDQYLFGGRGLTDLFRFLKKD